MEWRLAYGHHRECGDKIFTTIADVEASGLTIIPACVPGNFEVDMMKAGLLDDLYYSTNTLKAQELEDVHVWYYAEVEIANEKQYLTFEGIDTYADIYVNGQLVKTTDNMFLAHDVYADWVIGKNEVVVHIKPAMLEARKADVPAVCFAMNYNYASLRTRKAAHMYGWDIMPRIVSAGIWKDVHIKEKKADCIREVYLGTNRVDLEQKTAQLRLFVNADLSETIVQDYSIRIEGRCGESSYDTQHRMWHDDYAFIFDVYDCKYWWPKNAGEPNLYDVTVTLLYKGEVRDTYTLRHGIRTIQLEHTDVTDQDGNGEFVFRINGKKIFVMGTNWVPLDAFHSNDLNRLPKAMEMIDDIGVNMIRCWGGNVYEADEFFEYCDEHGIMVWQDFGMGCAVYPEDEAFQKALEEEAVYQIKRLRNHASLTLWAGDNECDIAHGWSGYYVNPTKNKLTRDVLPNAVYAHDYLKPFLPSSPYVSEDVYFGKGIAPEEHLWGPRDYFKGDFYKNTFCHFASETGYHGFNSPESLRRFLAAPEKIFEEDGTPTEEYLVHAASMETTSESPYTYRIRLAYSQVETLFGKAEEGLDDFVRQSQISQAEAKKYFIEKFRINKWKQTGIIWWNLLDGWPQVSDAIVDYYFVKKIAYHYIKRSQAPICLMFDEPTDGAIRLMAANDLPKDAYVKYSVKRISEEGDELCTTGEQLLPADKTIALDTLTIADGEKEFYYIEWECDGVKGKNHFVTNIIDIDYKKYMYALEKCGMNEFEGF